jgi:hypothetical protein
MLRVSRQAKGKSEMRRKSTRRAVKSVHLAVPLGIASPVIADLHDFEIVLAIVLAQVQQTRVAGLRFEIASPDYSLRASAVSRMVNHATKLNTFLIDGILNNNSMR